MRNWPLNRVCVWLGLIVLLLIHGSNACGALTHNEILRRARYLFSLTSESSSASPETSLFYRHHAAISQILSSDSVVQAEQAGAFFPDWGYGCLSNDMASEAAHWPPFISAAISHFYRKYGPLFTHDLAAGDATAGANVSRNVLWPNGTAMTEDEQDHKEKLLSFIYAATLHGSSDATWHSLRMYNGYVRMVAGQDFGGNYKDAHSLVDVGGDVILANRFDGMPPESRSKDWVSPTWWIPVDDIFEIYESMGITNINGLTFRFCIARGLAAIRAMITAGGALYEGYAEKSPAMVDHFDEYYLGGLDEMAANAAWCWRNLTVWMIEGHDDGSDGWNMCDTFKLINSRDGGKTGQSDPQFQADLAGNETDASKEHSWPYGILAEEHPQFAARLDAYEQNVFQDDKPFGVVEAYFPEGYIFDISTMTSAAEPGDTATTTSDKFHVPHPTPGPFKGSFLEPTFLRNRVPFSKFGSYLSLGNHGTGSMYTSDVSSLSDTQGIRNAQTGSLDLVVSAFTESDDQDYLAGGSVYSLNLKSIIGGDPGPLKFDDEYEERLKGNIWRLSSYGSGPAIISGRKILQTQTCHLVASYDQTTGTYKIVHEMTNIPSESVSSSGSPNHPNARFGAATTPVRLEAGTFNVVTTPGSQIYNDSSVWMGFVPSGSVDVFLGPLRILKLGFEQLPMGSLVGEREFGVSVLAADIDGDGEEELIIGAPYSDTYRPGCGVQLSEGEVIVIRLGKLISTHPQCVASDSAALEAEGIIYRVSLPVNEKTGEECNQNTYDWFGKSMVWLEKHRMVGIGAPGRGKVFFYKQNNATGELEYTFNIPGPQHQGFGGWGLESGVSRDGKEWVAVGVPNDENQIGHLRIYRIAESREGVHVATVVPDLKEKYGKFGTVLKRDDIEGGLWVGSPWASKEKGAVSWVDIQAIVDWDGNWKGARTGQVVLGPGCKDIETQEAVKEVEAAAVLWGIEEKAHFGSSIAVADVNGDGKSDLMVGVPYDGVSNANENYRFSGAVAVYLRSDETD